MPSSYSAVAKRRKAEGVPEAIRILSLHLPQLAGAQAPSGPEPMGAPGTDPHVAAVLQSLMRTLAPDAPADYEGLY